MTACDQRQLVRLRRDRRPRPSTSAPTGSPTTAAPYDGKTGIDSYGYQTYIHEIGHALGLGHQGPYNGSAIYSTNATYADDTWQYSVMSYFAENNYSGSSYRYVVTPQMADIYAVGPIYGAATDPDRRYRLWLPQHRRLDLRFHGLQPGARADDLRQRRQRHARLLRLFGGADHRPASGRFLLGRRPRPQYRDRAQRDHRECDRRQRQRHADRQRSRLHADRAAPATTR